MGKDNEILHAVKTGDVSTIRKILVKFKSGPKGRKSLSKKLHINIPDADGFTLLHHASLNESVDIVLALIEMEADPNSRDKKGMCPLHMAAWAGKDQIVKALLGNRALVNLPSFSGETPLLLASQHGYAAVVEVLLKHNADPTIRNNNLESPIDVACQFGHAAVVRLLLMRGEVIHMLHEKQKDPRFNLPLHLAAKGGHTDVMRLLIESGADISETTAQGTCLHLAALYGKVDVVKMLIEAGSNPFAVNQKNLTPLDMVNQFTTSRAGIEIKQLLKEATGEHVVFARATADHINVYDETCLQFKAGDTIMVLEKNEDGRWKGSINDGKVEKVGFFPSTIVTLISSNKQLSPSIGSISSSSDSSLNSANSGVGREANQTMKSPSRMTEATKPVGIVPVGTYEVLTLAKAPKPETKKPPNIPRLNSFKKDTKTAANQRRQLNDDVISNGNSSNRSSSADASIDSGVHSQSAVSTYDALPSSAKVASAEVNVHDPFHTPVKSPRIFPTHPPMDSSHFEETADHQANDEGAFSGNKYADISFRSNEKPHLESPRPHVQTYADVYVASNNEEVPPRLQSEARTIPQSSHGKLGFKESYENMHLNQELLSRFEKSTEGEKTSFPSNRSRGYDDNQSEDDLFPSPPPPLPLKSPPSHRVDEMQLPPSPPKKIESRALNYRRNESYENVLPRQIVPVHSQNPFSSVAQQNPPSQPPRSQSFGHYENYMASALTMQSKYTSGYENYRPPNLDQQIVRSATVTEKPSLKPVPLPPKMNRKNLQEPSSPSSPDSVRTPFLSHLDLQTLNEDEKELLNWLIELKLPQYFQNFQSEGYDMISARGITPEDLTVIEITKAGHRKKLLSEVTKLGASSKIPTHKPDDVGTWLKLLDLQEYETNFIEGGFDEMDFIKDLDLSDLEMIEIRKKGHQKKLLLAVQRLSDVELTAELDDIVSDDMKSPGINHVKENHQNEEKALQQNVQDYDILPPPVSKPPRSSQSSDIQQVAPIEIFPPPPPSSELEKAFVLNRDNLPPPSGKESTSHSLEQSPSRIPPAVPIRSVTEKPRQEENFQPSRTMTISLPFAPKPKPKPRLSQNLGQVRTASEYRAAESPSKSVVLPTASATTQKHGAIVEEQEPVTASKSRDFWLQNQQQQQNENRPLRAKSMSGIKPVLSPQPPTDTIQRQEKTTVHQDTQPPISNELKRGSLKKAPPPAPPRRDSMSKRKDANSNQGVEDTNQSGLAERSRTFSGPLDEKIRQALRGDLRSHTAHYDPIIEQAQQDVFPSPPAEKSTIEEELQATDSMMADIDHMIADFTSQLDSMFD